jgi:hypothetical protein
VNQANKVVLEVQNNGNCAWDDQTTLVFDSGDDLRPAGQPIIAVPPAAPGDKVQVELNLQPTAAKTYTSKWLVRLASGRDVGLPFTLTYKGLAATTSITATTSSLATPKPGSATSTPFVAKGLAGVSLRVQSCAYADTNYTCSVAVNIDGGSPVWNVAIDGANGGQFTWDINDARFWQMVAPRCEAVSVTITVIDADNDQVQSTLVFDPTTAAVFPGSTTCSIN